jgi:hypothetical protein
LEDRKAPTLNCQLAKKEKGPNWFSCCPSILVS